MRRAGAGAGAGIRVAPKAASLAVFGVSAALACCLLLALAARPAPALVPIAAYATALEERSAGQRQNARLAAAALNGRVIPAGGEFSFNRTVKPWTVDRGYVKAPVSYDGELVMAYGGGICQVSTTLYNAALLAGLTVVERHPHVFAPHYATPGRDAAVAQYTIDLRFRNPYRWPLRIEARAADDRVEVRLLARERPAGTVTVRTEVLGITEPRRVVRAIDLEAGDRGSRPLVRRGAVGFRVLTYRVIMDGEHARRERLSDDTYQATDQLVALPAGD